MEHTRHLYLRTAILWQQLHRRYRHLPLIVQAMVRHPVLTLTPLLITALLIGAALTPTEPSMSRLHVTPHTATTP